MYNFKLLNKLINKGMKGHMKSACFAGDGVSEVIINNEMVFSIRCFNKSFSHLDQLDK